jgi:hypothetical protein
MKRSLTWLAGFLFLIAVPCFGAETATVTLLFGQPKLLRGTTWFNLKEGVRLRDGDVIDLPASGQLQLEFTDTGAVSVIGPARFTSSPPRRATPSRPGRRNSSSPAAG